MRFTIFDIRSGTQVYTGATEAECRSVLEDIEGGLVPGVPAGRPYRIQDTEGRSRVHPDFGRVTEPVDAMVIRHLRGTR